VWRYPGGVVPGVESNVPPIETRRVAQTIALCKAFSTTGMPPTLKSSLQPRVGADRAALASPSRPEHLHLRRLGAELAELSAQRSSRKIRRSARGRELRRLGGLTELRQKPRDALGAHDQRAELHSATGARSRRSGPAGNTPLTDALASAASAGSRSAKSVSGAAKSSASSTTPRRTNHRTTRATTACIKSFTSAVDSDGSGWKQSAPLSPSPSGANTARPAAGRAPRRPSVFRDALLARLEAPS
jgi:hypothetical protein